MKAAILLITILGFSAIEFISATTYTCDPTVSCGCSTVSTVVTARIAGGEPAKNNTWGWMVSLQLNNSHICGASLLTPEYAITAAHCVVNNLNDTSTLSILAGTNYLNDVSSPTIQRRTVTQIMSHPNYDHTSFVNDIAIIRFSPLNVSLDSKLTFICLPEANQDQFQVNSSLVAIGWGVNFILSDVPSNYLQQVTVQVGSSTSDTCVQSNLVDPDVEFCAGVITGGKDTCPGDSGGPLMAFVNNRWVLAGLTSNGFACALPNYLGVYTRVSAFIPFIDANANISVPETTPVSITTLNNQTQTPWIGASNNQTGSNGSQNNMIDKFIFILILSCILLFS